jgi:hypothetical protein
MERETFCAAVHLYNQYHFEDTPREAARVQTLAASLLLEPVFFAGERALDGQVTYRYAEKGWRVRKLHP